MDNKTGSFAASIGGMSPELQAAMNRRANSGNTLNQVSTGAPTFDPNTQPPPPVQSSAPQPPAMPNQPIPPTSAAPSPLGMEDTETKMIIKALEGRLKTISKMQEMQGGA